MSETTSSSASSFAGFFKTDVFPNDTEDADDDDGARDGTGGVGRRLYDTMTETLTTTWTNASTVKELVADIAERMNFCPSRNGNPHLKKPQTLKVVLRGDRNLGSGDDDAPAILKITLVDGEALRRCRDVHDISASHRLSALNECIWLQQLTSETSMLSPRVLDMRLWRSRPAFSLDPQSDRSKPFADPVFVAVLMKDCGVSVCAWLSAEEHAKTSDRSSINRDVIAGGAGFRLLKRGSEHERCLANRMLRRIILLFTRRLHRLQRLNGLVHHDLHTDNVLLYRRDEDEVQAVYPVISDYEFAEGMLRASTASEYVAGSYPFSYANNLTYSYDLYRFMSDLLYVIHRNGLNDCVDAEIVDWLRLRVAARFDAIVAHAEHTAACGKLRRRHQVRIFQPHLRDLACDPIELLRWQPWLKKVAENEDVRDDDDDDDRAEIAREDRSCFWLRWLKTQTRELDRNECLRERYFRAIDHLKFHGSKDLDPRLYARLPLINVLRRAILYFVYRLDEAHHQVKVGTTRSELPGYAWCCLDDAFLPRQHADLFARLRLVQSVLSVFFLWLSENSSTGAGIDDDDVDWIVAAFPSIEASAIPNPVYGRECARFAEGVLAATAVVLRSRRYVTYLAEICARECFVDIRCSAEQLTRAAMRLSRRPGGVLRRVRDSGAARVMPVPCLLIPSERRDDLSSHVLLQALCERSMDPHIYHRARAHMFANIYRRVTATATTTVDSDAAPTRVARKRSRGF
ncbi:hypothetical protein CYMTET_56087 [Cymbomonas tetramitiformis]|uniref:Protein kinase domain-containing protein n=1 Tax=Cymbomonas tetramitiformis TaxID=36881 RepID=A0AAE0EP39_9CHLO|nr:hypothetical protein CYMTET_56087 [Cymbomonas tetramitiformis]